MKVLSVFGTRPEAIKMGPLVRALAEAADIESLVCITGQHRAMLDQVMSLFEITADHDLDVMVPNQTLNGLCSRLFERLDALYTQVRPDYVLVHGDTTTAMTAALAAFHHRIPIGHVEAGLRTGDINRPWPEEMNRRLADPISRWCFAPTEVSRDNLLAERMPPARLFVTGNTVIDSLLWMRNRLRDRGVAAAEVGERCKIPQAFADEYLSAGSARRWILVTGHRRESFGGGFENICKAIAGLVERYPDLGVLYPVHLNPNVQEPVTRLLGGNPRVALIPPVGYEDFIWLMDRCTFVLSDSGGVQEEAPSLGTPVLVLREDTERPEGIEAGCCALVGSEPQRITAEASRLLSDQHALQRMIITTNPYGDGKAAKRALTAIKKYFAEPSDTAPLN